MGDKDVGPSIIKIGVSKELDKRLKDLNKHSPHKVYLLKAFGNLLEEDAYRIEGILHELYKAQKVNFRRKFDGYTEWFYLQSDLEDVYNNVNKLLKSEL